MLIQNLKYALRHLVNNRFYSILNTLGLSLGLGISLIIYFIIHQEITFDHFHKNIRQLYQVLRYEPTENGSFIKTEISIPGSVKIMQEIPEIAQVVRIPVASPQLICGNNKINEHGIYADSSFFSVFSFELNRGIGSSALSSPDKIVVSQRLAEKYFRGEDPMGKILTIAGNKDISYMISGIMKDIPENSSLRFDFVIPISSYLFQNPGLETSWTDQSVQVFVSLFPEASVKEAAGKITGLYKENIPDDKNELFLESFSRRHAFAPVYKDAAGESLMPVFIVLGFLGSLILLIACINYVNLSTAMYAKRMKETGIKKVLGSSRYGLSLQYLLEAFIVSSIALALGLAVVQGLLNEFNKAFMRHIGFDYSDPSLWFYLSVLLLITTLLSGIYPAFFLSSFEPLQILKTSSSSFKSRSGFRKSMVVIQFFVTIFLIIFSLASYRQINYIKNKDLGMNIENVELLEMNMDAGLRVLTFKNELEKAGPVREIAQATQNPLLILSSTDDIEYEGKNHEDRKWAHFINTDFNFIRVMKLNIMKGRDFDEALATDSANYIINQTAASGLGLKEPVGSRIKLSGREGTVIGIVQDFHMTHLNLPVKPLIIGIASGNYSYALIRLNEGMYDQGMEVIKNVYNKHFTGSPFNCISMRDSFMNIYRENVFRVGKLVSLFSLLAIFISCLGLMGMTLFTTEQRTKEIGIRRINGASVITIIKMLTRDYTKWIWFSFFLAAPAAFLMISKLFSRTAHHTDISPWIFIYAGLVVFSIAILTIGWQVFRAASRNPVEALRYE